MNERDQANKKKPKNFIDGGVKGVTSIGTGLLEGIGGILV
jgi:hypothetical protein